MKDTPVQKATDSIRDALALLVQLKDGPRDQVYYDTRDEAWQSAREALAAHPAEPVPMDDDEEFCPKCFAGMTAANHDECTDLRHPTPQPTLDAAAHPAEPAPDKRLVGYDSNGPLYTSAPVQVEITDSAAAMHAATAHDPEDCRWPDTLGRCTHIEVPHPMRNRGRETSDALVSVRTVLSRAETALIEIERGEYACDDGGYPIRDESGEWITYPDEDYDEMRAALERVVESLEWWRRTGRPRKGD
jgi:hypothetical protein